MTRLLTLRRILFFGAVGLLIPTAPVTSQSPQRFRPRLEPVAETKLLMEGMNMPNFRALEGLLKTKPADDEAWTFARGQAMLIAETGNLLMLRPPRNQGQDAWMERATELRATAARLARTAGDQDYERSRAGLGELANACNRCHQTFRVSVRIKPFTDTRAERGTIPELP